MLVGDGTVGREPMNAEGVFLTLIDSYKPDKKLDNQGDVRSYKLGTKSGGLKESCHGFIPSVTFIVWATRPIKKS